MVWETSTWQINKTNYLNRYIWAAVRPQLMQIQTGGLKTSLGEKSRVFPSFPLHTVFIWTSHFVTSLAKALVEAWHHGCMLWVLKRTHKEEVAETHAAVSFHFVSKRFALVCIMTSQIWPDKGCIADRLFRKGNPLATVNFSFWHDWQVVDLFKELGAVSISRKQGWVWTWLQEKKSSFIDSWMEVNRSMALKTHLVCL